MILDYPGGPKVIIWALKWERGWQKYQDLGDAIRRNTWLAVVGSEARRGTPIGMQVASKRWKGKKWILPWSLQKEMQSC